MSDQDTIFNKDDSTQVPAGEQTTQTPTGGDQTPKAVDMNAVFADQLSAITNDQGAPKYTDVSTALYALKASQGHIQNLEDENKELRQQSTTDANMQTIMDQLNSNKNVQDQTGQGQLSVEDIKGIASAAYVERQALLDATTNQSKVSKAISERYGEKAEEVYLQKAADLNLPVEELNRLAAMSPEAALSYFDIANKAETFKTTSTGSVNIDALGQTIQPDTGDKQIMYGASTGEVVGLWRSTADQVNKEYNIEG